MAEANQGMRELFQLAIPMVASRAGLGAMAIADVVMVGRHGAAESAALALADGTFGRMADLCTAFLLGGLVLIPRAFGAGDLAACQRIWRRSLVPALGLGLLTLLLCGLARPLWHLLDEPASLVEGAAPVALALGVGFPAGLVAICAAVYLEGIRRPRVVALAVIAGNLLNLLFNWLLIGGHGGLPALGALGSAWSTTLVRLGLALGLGVLAARALAHGGSGPRAAPREEVDQPGGRDQRQWQLGGAALLVQTVMLALVACLTVFAGWLGPLDLAALVALMTLNAPAMLLALGVADATAVRVAAVAGGGAGPTATRAAAVQGLLLCAAVLLPLGLLASASAGTLAGWFTRDPQVYRQVAALVPLAECMLVADGLSFVAVGAARALLDLVWPTAIEAGTMLLMVLLAAWLAFAQGEGLRGVMLATAITSVLRAVLLLARLFGVQHPRPSGAPA